MFDRYFIVMKKEKTALNYAATKTRFAYFNETPSIEVSDNYFSINKKMKKSAVKCGCQ